MLADVVGSFIFGWCILAETSGNPYRRRLSSIGDPYGNISETQSLIDGPHSYGMPGPCINSRQNVLIT